MSFNNPPEQTAYRTIKIDGKKFDLSKFKEKGGFRVTEDMSARQRSVFGVLDGNKNLAKNGQVDGVIDAEELGGLVEFIIQKSGAHGNKKSLGKKEFIELIDALAVGDDGKIEELGLTPEDLKSFVEELLDQCEIIATSDVVYDEEEDTRIVNTKYNNGVTENVYSNGNYAKIYKNGNKDITENYDVHHTRLNDTIVEGSVTTKITYKQPNQKTGNDLVIEQVVIENKDSHTTETITYGSNNKPVSSTIQSGDAIVEYYEYIQRGDDGEPIKRITHRSEDKGSNYLITTNYNYDTPGIVEIVTAEPSAKGGNKVVTTSYSDFHLVNNVPESQTPLRTHIAEGEVGNRTITDIVYTATGRTQTSHNEKIPVNQTSVQYDKDGKIINSQYIKNGKIANAPKYVNGHPVVVLQWTSDNKVEKIDAIIQRYPVLTKEQVLKANNGKLPTEVGAEVIIPVDGVLADDYRLLNRDSAEVAQQKYRIYQNQVQFDETMENAGRVDTEGNGNKYVASKDNPYGFVESSEVICRGRINGGCLIVTGKTTDGKEVIGYMTSDGKKFLSPQQAKNLRALWNQKPKKEPSDGYDVKIGNKQYKLIGDRETEGTNKNQYVALDMNGNVFIYANGRIYEQDSNDLNALDQYNKGNRIPQKSSIDVVTVIDKDGATHYFSKTTGKELSSTERDSFIAKEAQVRFEKLLDADTAWDLGMDFWTSSDQIKEYVNGMPPEVRNRIVTKFKSKYPEYVNKYTSENGGSALDAFETWLYKVDNDSKATANIKQMLAQGSYGDYKQRAIESARIAHVRLDQALSGWTSESGIREALDLIHTPEAYALLERNIKKDQPNLAARGGDLSSYVYSAIEADQNATVAKRAMTTFMQNDVYYEYERDASGEILLDESGVPVVKEKTDSLKDAEGNVIYQVDEQGNFVLDENGEKIPVADKRYVYMVDSNGQPIFDDNGKPILALDNEGNPVIRTKTSRVVDQTSRNWIITANMTDEDEENLDRILEAINPDSPDYDRFLEVAGAHERTAAIYGQDVGQSYLYERLKNDPEEIEAANYRLFSTGIPPKIQAEMALNAYYENHNANDLFASYDSETYVHMQEIMKNDPKFQNIGSLRELYEKGLDDLSYPDKRPYAKIAVKASYQVRALIAGVPFSDSEIDQIRSSLDKAIYGEYEVIEYKQNNPDGNAFQPTGYNNNNLSNAESALKHLEQYLKIKEQKSNPEVIMVNETVVQDGKEVTQHRIISDPSEANKIKEQRQNEINQLKQNVALAKRQHMMQMADEGWFSAFANEYMELLGSDFDRTDLQRAYNEAEIILMNMELAAKGQLKDDKGNIISYEDYKASLDVNSLHDANNNYVMTNAKYKGMMKMGIIIAATMIITQGVGAFAIEPLVAAGTITTGTAEVLTLSTAAATAGGTTFGLNYSEAATSVSGNTDDAMWANIQESGVAAVTTLLGGKASQYIIGRNAQAALAQNTPFTSLQQCRHLLTNISELAATDVAIAAGSEKLMTGELTWEGMKMALIFSVSGNIIGYRNLIAKNPAGRVNLSDSAPQHQPGSPMEPQVRQPKNKLDAATNFGENQIGGMFSQENYATLTNEIRAELEAGVTPERATVLLQEIEQLGKVSRSQAGQLRTMVEDATGIYATNDGYVNIATETDVTRLTQLQERVNKWNDPSRDKVGVSAKIEQRIIDVQLDNLGRTTNEGATTVQRNDIPKREDVLAFMSNQSKGISEQEYEQLMRYIQGVEKKADLDEIINLLNGKKMILVQRTNLQRAISERIASSDLNPHNITLGEPATNNIADLSRRVERVINKDFPTFEELMALKEDVMSLQNQNLSDGIVNFDRNTSPYQNLLDDIDYRISQLLPDELAKKTLYDNVMSTVNSRYVDKMTLTNLKTEVEALPNSSLKTNLLNKINNKLSVQSNEKFLVEGLNTVYDFQLESFKSQEVRVAFQERIDDLLSGLPEEYKIFLMSEQTLRDIGNIKIQTEGKTPAQVASEARAAVNNVIEANKAQINARKEYLSELNERLLQEASLPSNERVYSKLFEFGEAGGKTEWCDPNNAISNVLENLVDNGHSWSSVNNILMQNKDFIKTSQQLVHFTTHPDDIVLARDLVNVCKSKASSNTGFYNKYKDTNPSLANLYDLPPELRSAVGENVAKIILQKDVMLENLSDLSNYIRMGRNNGGKAHLPNGQEIDVNILLQNLSTLKPWELPYVITLSNVEHAFSNTLGLYSSPKLKVTEGSYRTVVGIGKDSKFHATAQNLLDNGFQGTPEELMFASKLFDPSSYSGAINQVRGLKDVKKGQAALASMIADARYIQAHPAQRNQLLKKFHEKYNAEMYQYNAETLSPVEDILGYAPNSLSDKEVRMNLTLDATIVYRDTHTSTNFVEQSAEVLTRYNSLLGNENVNVTNLNRTTAQSLVRYATLHGGFESIDPKFTLSYLKKSCSGGDVSDEIANLAKIYFERIGISESHPQYDKLLSGFERELTTLVRYQEELPTTSVASLPEFTDVNRKASNGNRVVIRDGKNFQGAYHGTGLLSKTDPKYDPLRDLSTALSITSTGEDGVILSTSYFTPGHHDTDTRMGVIVEGAEIALIPYDAAYHTRVMDYDSNALFFDNRAASMYGNTTYFSDYRQNLPNLIDNVQPSEIAQIKSDYAQRGIILDDRQAATQVVLNRHSNFTESTMGNVNQGITNNGTSGKYNELLLYNPQGKAIVYLADNPNSIPQIVVDMADKMGYDIVFLYRP